MEYAKIIENLPYTRPFLFVDRLLTLSGDGVTGDYTFPVDSHFYQGHFKDFPVTPGVILTECCAQIGLVCLGIYLLSEGGKLPLNGTASIGMSGSEMEFYLPVPPGERVTVVSEKVYYRFYKLKCRVRMYNGENQLVCKGTISGMLKTTSGG